MATMTTPMQSEFEVKISATGTEPEGVSQEVLRIMEASASAIELQIASSVEKARGELLRENDKLRDELQQAQLLLAGTEEAAAIALERQIMTAVERARTELQTENDRLREEFLRAKQLLTEYEQVASERERANKLLADAVESQRAALGEREKVASDFQAELRAERQRLEESWESERERLAQECGELRHERNRFREELGRLADSAAKSDSERARLKEECERLKTQQRANNEVLEEAARVESAMHEISRSIADPSTELPVVIRKNVERAQLDAYLRGLRFACGQK